MRSALSRWFNGSVATSASGLLGRFSESRAGNITMMFAVLSIPMISAVGMGVDLTRAYRIKAITQNTLDSAVLAAGRAAQTNYSAPLTAAQSAATTYFDATKPKDVLSSTLSLVANNTNTVFTLTATTWISTPFLGVLSRLFTNGAESGSPSGCSSKYSCLKITSSATASIAAGGNGGSNIEVSLMLDVTGSMSGTKISTLITAAGDLVDTIVWSDQSKYTSRVAIVPFAANVNVGSDYYTAVTNQSQTVTTSWGWGWGGWSTTYDPCVIDRTGSNAYTETAPASGSWIPSASTTSCTPGAAIVPLTSNKTTLKNTINNLTANGGTAGPLGTAWAWYMISPSWASIWGTASAPGAYADLTTMNSNGTPKLRKFAVLMTDGDYNIMSGDDVSQSTANTAALSVCTNMKAKGIEIYTVGFQLSGNTAKNMLTSCASSTDKFYDASSNAQLQAAFRDIALKISSLRLTN